MKLRCLLPLLLGIIALADLTAQSDYLFEQSGDAGVAERYLEWAEQRIAEGRWNDALAALERAKDFSDVSSDLSYMLAIARSHEGKPRGSVLEALGRAIEAKRWNRYTPAQAHLLEAEQLIVMRHYAWAIASLGLATESADAAMLRLAALKGLAADTRETTNLSGTTHATAEFRRNMLAAMDRYPGDPRPLRILFEYARNKIPTENDLPLMELALRRLPFLSEVDPELLWLATPFIRDSAEAVRFAMAYRAGASGKSNPASLPDSLMLGIISGNDAVEELFSFAAGKEPFLSKEIILALSALLVNEEDRELLAQKLHRFSGIIASDANGDGYPEYVALYRNGVITEYTFDADQDGIAELKVYFNPDGSPKWASRVLSASIDFESSPAIPVRDEDCLRAYIYWERYPSVLNTNLGDTVFIPRPVSFQYAPLRFSELAPGGSYAGLSWPQYEADYAAISHRSLVSFSLYIRKPSADFENASEQFELNRGIPVRAVSTLNGKIVAETIFEQGLPVLQRLDLDLDSRMETIRRFRKPVPLWDDFLDYRSLLASSESDWNGDGIFEYGELYLEDGSVVYSWDMNGDGRREYSETKPGN